MAETRHRSTYFLSPFGNAPALCLLLQRPVAISSWPWCERDPALSSKLADCDNEGSGHRFHGCWGRLDGRDPAAPTLLANLWHPGSCSHVEAEPNPMWHLQPICASSVPSYCTVKGKGKAGKRKQKE